MRPARYSGELVAILGIGSALLGAVAYDNTRRQLPADSGDKVDAGVVQSTLKTIATVGRKR
jgi:hypothetical protein